MVDAKASLNAYLESLEAQDDASRAARLEQHAMQLRTHIDQLSRKSYGEQFDCARFRRPVFPGEVFFSAALERDPSLIEYGVGKNVMLASPTVLIPLLRAVYYGWKEERLALNAREVWQLGSELYKRFADRQSICKIGQESQQLDRRL